MRRVKASRLAPVPRPALARRRQSRVPSSPDRDRAASHGFFRGSAAWRVRIALALKGLPVEQAAHHQRRGEQRAPDYLALNPQGLVPALILDSGETLTQSLAIIAWLDEAFPAPAFLPADPAAQPDA